MDTTVALSPVTAQPIKQYEKLLADIAILKDADKAASFQYADPKGNKLARSHVFAMRQAKGDVERARKGAKADALEFGRRVDAAAADLEAQIDSMIKPHQDELDKIEAVEINRVNAHKAKLAAIRGTGPTIATTSAAIREALAAVEVIATADMQEFAAEADNAKTLAVAALNSSLAAAIKREDEAAELASLRAEAVARADADRIARVQREAVEAEQNRAKEADAKRVAAEQMAALARQSEQDEKDRAAQAAVDAAVQRETEAQARADLAASEKADAERRATELAERVKAEQDNRAREQAESVARKAAALKAKQDNRAAMVAQIAADLATLKKEGAIGSMTALAECIVAGRLRNVVINWES